LPHEQKLIDRHLSGCARCSSEKIELEFLDQMLDTWCTEESPPDITDSIMSIIQNEESPVDRNNDNGSRAKSVFLRGLLKDLVAAAAVTLILFGAGGSWLSPGSFDALGQNVNVVARSYTNITNNTVERVVSAADTYTGKITVEEWNLDAMYKSR